MSQTDRHNFLVCFNLIEVQYRSPVNVLRAQHNWLFVLSMLENCDVEWCVEFGEHRGVKLDLFIVTNKFKEESFIKYGVCRTLNQPGGVAVFQKADRYRDVFIWSYVDKVDESIALDNCAGEIALVWIKTRSFNELPLAWSDCWNLISIRTIRK